MIEKQTNQTMTILAKELKVGMTVTTGCLSIVIKEIEKGFQKNGTPTVTVIGTGTKNKRTMEGWDAVFKELTKVKITN
jgi:hypothetical protein